MYHVYGDVFFVVNFAVNYLLLYLTAYLAQKPSTRTGIAGGALLGAVYSLGYLFSGLRPLYYPPVVVLFPALMVWIGLRPRTYSVFIRLLVTFYSMALLTAGTAFAVGLLQEGLGSITTSRGTFSLSLWGYLGVGLAALLFVVLLRSGVRKRQHTADNTYTLEAVLGDRVVRFDALLDTGLLIEEPLGGAPLVLVDEQLVEKLVPGLVAETNGRVDENSAEVCAEGLSVRLRFIPYNTVGSGSGLLSGISVDRITFVTGRNKGTVLAPATLAWTQGVAADDDSYQALFGPAVLDSLNGREQLA